jgi:CBS domain-containing protein
MEKLLQNRVVFLSGDTSMRDVIRTMRDRNISSVLITDVDHRVSGIITERDIVQKFTLLEVADKLNAKANAVMTRPVMMARVSHLYQDIVGLFRSRGFRHFPVTSSDNHEKSIIGIMTVTDIAGAWLSAHSKKVHGDDKAPLVIISGDNQQTSIYEQLFSQLGLTPETEGLPEDLLSKALDRQLPILLDIDQVGIDKAKRYLSMVRKHGSVLVLLSSDAKLVQALRDHLHGPLMSVCLKPLDISQILRTIRQVQTAATELSA